MAAQKKHINLLPPDPFEQSLVNKFLKWALSIGRYIVMGTELVVIGAFLARFSLDRQVTDLNEAIAQRQAVVESYGKLEGEIRSIQARMKSINELEANQLGIGMFVEDISSMTPIDVAYTNIELAKNRLGLRGQAYSEAGFRTLMAELNTSDKVSKTVLKEVSLKGGGDGGIEFEVEVELKKMKTNGI